MERWKNNSRRKAAFVVARWLATREHPDRLLPDGSDRAFVQDLAYTALRRMRPLRTVLGELLRRWPKGELEALLYVGAAQILYMDDVPDFAAVNETVSAAGLCGNPSIPRVVNGVLRSLVRRREEFAAKLSAAPLEERESFPTALVRRWTARFGGADAERLCRWFNEPAETFLAGRDGSFSRLERGKRVCDVPGYAEGDFVVQDPGTALAVELTDVRPGETVLDACAAPGGKTAQLAWRGAKVTACEVNPSRRTRLEQNIRRLGLDVETAGSLQNLAGRAFRKILVDAPCSNTGVLRRRPDARWNWTEKKMEELVRIQAEILETAAAMLESGGRLVYSTCSLEPEENHAQVEAFLGKHPGFALVAEKESVPFVSGCDGAYAAALERR